MISKIVRCAAHSPLHALVFAPLLALAVLGAGGTPSFAAQEADEAERNATAAESAGEDPDAPGSPRFFGSAIEWNLGDAESATVAIGHPDGTVTRHEFGPGEVPRIELGFAASALADGFYLYEVVGYGRRQPPTHEESARPTGREKTSGFVRSGSFLVTEGAPAASDEMIRRESTSADEPARSTQEGTQVFNDFVTFQKNVLFNGIIGFGERASIFPAAKAESIFIKDPRPSGGLYKGWRLAPVAPAGGSSLEISSVSSPNETLNPLTVLTTPFRIAFGAPNGALTVDNGGRIGLRTLTPAKDLHINTSGSPTIRLERNASGGGTARIWDIGASATNFFIGDNASRFPFQIQPAAPTGSLFLAASGNVGVGTDAPGAKLHVYGANGSTSETIEEASASSALRTLLNLRNRGGTRTLYDDTAIPQSWSVGTQNSAFVIDELAHPGFELLIEANGNVTVGQDAFVGRDLDVARHARVGGNLTVLGQLIQPSSRSLKRDFAPIDAQAVLDLVVAMPVSTWSYNSDASVRHMGPVAEDFHAAFGLGGTDRGIATVDSDGVALAAIQGLHQKLQSLENENQELRQRLEAMDRALAGLLAERESPRP